MSHPGTRAEAMISELGIGHPSEIDVEAIALDAGMRVEYANLQGCEATLVGVHSAAIATVRRSPIRGRERFSIAHELGHWCLHRGQSFRCRVADVDENLAANKVVEREADTFAAHLLLPGPMFIPAIRQIGRPSFAELQVLSNEYEASLLATSLRLVNVNALPLIFACYGRQGLKWFLASEDVPRRWFLKNQLDADSFAYDLVNSGTPCKRLSKQSAETWFENPDAEDFEVFEHCVDGRGGEVHVLIYLTNEAALHTRFDESVGNRRYTANGSYLPKRPK